MRSIYDNIAEDEPGPITGAQIEAAIGQTRAGSPSDGFYAAYDAECSRIRAFWRSVKDDPVILERIAAPTSFELTGEHAAALLPALDNEIAAWQDADCGEDQADNDAWVRVLREMRDLVAAVAAL